MNNKVKIACVHIIPYVHSHKKLFPYSAMTTIAMFERQVVFMNENKGRNRRENFSFGAIPSPKILDLERAREDFPLLDG